MRGLGALRAFAIAAALSVGFGSSVQVKASNRISFDDPSWDPNSGHRLSGESRGKGKGRSRLPKARHRTSWFTPNGERECARRRRQPWNVHHYADARSRGDQ